MTIVAALALMIIAAKPMRPGHIPGDRLITNLTERLKKEPGNTEIYYLIGRAHYATFSKAVESSWSNRGEVEVYDHRQKDGLPIFYTLPGNIYPWDSKTAVKDTSDNRRHIEGAISSLRTALNMTNGPGKIVKGLEDPGLAHLTLGCTFESGALLAGKVKLAEPLKNLVTTQQWRLAAASEYLLAFNSTIAEDRKVHEEPIWGLRSLVAYEAGLSYLRLQPASKQSKGIKVEIDKLLKLPPPRMITPLVMDLTGSKPLTSLLDNSHQVEFDLDGSARPQTYGWVKPTTAFLVWDPFNEGKVTSGRQLFGNATWWMLWDNAYAALDALDDNRDGWLSGKELKGLALWYDRNGNGISDPGEVISINNTQIASIRTRFDGPQGESFVSSQGVRLKDGRVLPTYDWVTTNVTPDAQH